MYYSFTTSKIHATVGSKIVQFSTQSILICLIISGSLRLVSLVKMSEAAGIQILGPDNVAIRKFRFIVFSLSSLISMVLIQEIGNYEIIFYPDAEILNVILHFTPQNTMAARVQSIAILQVWTVPISTSTFKGKGRIPRIMIYTFVQYLSLLLKISLCWEAV